MNDETDNTPVNPVMNIDTLEYTNFSDGQEGDAHKFEAEYCNVSSQIGAELLGYSIYRLPPGKAAFPFHMHHGMEEMFMILEGTGTLRFGEQEYPLRGGDIIACPPGPGKNGEGRGHQIRNSGDSVMIYLAMSDMKLPEVVEYPDSGKFGAMGGDPKIGPAGCTFRTIARVADGVDYWDGEV